MPQQGLRSTPSLDVDLEAIDEVIDEDRRQVLSEQAEVDPSSVCLQLVAVGADRGESGGRAHTRWTTSIRDHSQASVVQGHNPVINAAPKRLTGLSVEEIGEGANGLRALCIDNGKIH
ncbi:hypothetical protein [Streptosporangium canum]|uniref:hypothetical protein n=1 Tax=Streptosporangium canum TaxID=324952 RepID=UPI001C433BAE|nr:hypothetical protein [Streptosporangium canum]